MPAWWVLRQHPVRRETARQAMRRVHEAAVEGSGAVLARMVPAHRVRGAGGAA